MINGINIRIIGAFFAVIVLSSCGKTYTGEVESSGNGIGTSDEDIPVMLAVSDPSMLTRGSGAFDKELGNVQDMWEKSRFYIYAFCAEENSDFRTLSRNDKTQCLVDGSVDNHGSKMGKKARLNSDRASYLLWDGGSNVFYEREEQTRPFLFFGFYIDDIVVPESNIIRTESAVKLRNIRIDGRQDIMSSVAQLTEEQKKLVEDMNEKELVMNSLYSAYSTRLGIYPVLSFHHELARVKFKIFPAKSDADHIYVQNITMESKVNADFTVAAKDKEAMGLDFSEYTETIPMRLCETDGGALKQDYYVAPLLPGEESITDPYSRTGVFVGESLLVAPNLGKYKMTVDLKQNINGVTKTYTTEYELETAFKAGYAYTVRVAINGLDDLDFNVQVDGWRDGGNIEINPGDEWTNE